MVTAMFMGEYDHTIDAKGRLIVPVKFREGLGDSFVVSRGFDHCLLGWNLKAWETMQEKLVGLPLNDRKSRKIARFFMAGAERVEYDRQGRILIPAPLRSYAGLTKDVVLAGVGTRIEIWDAVIWREQIAEDIDDIGQDLEEMGFVL